MFKHAFLGLAGVVAIACGGAAVQPSATPSLAPTPTDSSSAAPTASPTPVPTASPAPTASSAGVVEDPQGLLQAGVAYAAHPFDTLVGMDARAFTFEVPSGNWEAVADPGNMIGVVRHHGSEALGFLKVHSLNSDACQWATDDDIELGPTVEDLVEALADSTTIDSGAGPYSENTNTLTGQGVELSMPDPLPSSGCDEGNYRIWNAEGFDIYAQGSANTWRLGIFDVDGNRYIVMASYMPETPDDVRDELLEIFRSVSIDEEPGCPQSSTSCN